MITVKKSEYNKAKLRKLFKEASQQYIQITDEEAQELGLIEQTPTGPTGEQEPETPTGNTEPQEPTGEESINIQYEIYEDENNDIILNIISCNKNNIYISNCYPNNYGYLINKEEQNNFDKYCKNYNRISYGEFYKTVNIGKNIINNVATHAFQDIYSYDTKYILFLCYLYKGCENTIPIIFELNHNPEFYSANIKQNPVFDIYYNDDNTLKLQLIKPLIFEYKENEISINNINDFDFATQDVGSKQLIQLNKNYIDNNIIINYSEINNFDSNIDVCNFWVTYKNILGEIDWKFRKEIRKEGCKLQYNNIETFNYLLKNNSNNNELLNIIMQKLNCQSVALNIYQNPEIFYHKNDEYYYPYNNYIVQNNDNDGSKYYYNINMIFNYIPKYLPADPEEYFLYVSKDINVNNLYKYKLFFTINNVDFITVNCGYDITNDNNEHIIIDPITGEKTIVNNE